MLKNILSFLISTFVDAFRLTHSPEELKSLYGVSLYRNAVYLMASSGVTVFLGFIFWIVVARLYPPSYVGLGSALISAAALLSFIGTLGLGFGIIRFLPNSEDKAQLLNSSFTLATFTAVAVAVMFLSGLSLWSPKLVFVRQSPVFFASFVIFTVAYTLIHILSPTYVAFLQARFTLAVNIISGLLKLILAAGFTYIWGVFGIFASWGVGVAVSLLVGLFVFLPRVLPHYRLVPSLQRQSSNEMVHFSFVNYISHALWQFPVWILPLLVVNVLGAEANAYFYITWAMSFVLFAIPEAASISLFAEGAHVEERLGESLRKSLKLIILLLIPAIVIMVVFGDKFLLLFGRQYSAEGSQLLRLLVPAALPASINLLYLGVARVEKRLKNVLLVTAAVALGTLIPSYLLLPHLNILGVGVAWLAAQTMVALVVAPRLMKRLREGHENPSSQAQGCK